jgi:hypothetical protein
METYGFAVFAIGLLGVAWWLTRLMSSTGRNDETVKSGSGGGRFGL